MPATGLILLAAGGSSRLGRPKQLLPFRGRSLLRHAAETALASVCRPVVVVLGAQSGLFESELRGAEVTIATNPGWEAGLGSSIRCGVEKIGAVAGAPLDAVVIMLCDQPLVSAAHLDRLVALRRSGGTEIVASAYGEALGVPALFGRRFFGALASLPDADGARRLILENRSEAVGVPFPDAGFDVDSEADYRQLTEFPRDASPGG